jgi:hypothetical protein
MQGEGSTGYKRNFAGLGGWLMKDNGEAGLRVRPRRMSSIVAALAMAVAVWVLSAQCDAAEPAGSPPAHRLSTLLAAASENILSESAMADQKGAGLRPPSITANEENGAPKVMLWDEMKTSPIMNPPPDGVVTGGIGGK